MKILFFVKSIYTYAYGGGRKTNCYFLDTRNALSFFTYILAFQVFSFVLFSSKKKSMKTNHLNCITHQQTNQSVIGGVTQQKLKKGQTIASIYILRYGAIHRI